MSEEWGRGVQEKTHKGLFSDYLCCLLPRSQNHSFNFLTFIYFDLGERERAPEQGRGGEGDTEAPGSELSAQSGHGAQTHQR